MFPSNQNYNCKPIFNFIIPQPCDTCNSFILFDLLIIYECQVHIDTKKATVNITLAEIPS